MPTGLLQTLLDRATTPMVPQSATQPMVDSLTEPHLTQSPTMARIKGFAGGALEGARQLTSPANVGGMFADDLPIGLVAKYAPALGKFGKAASMLGPEATSAATAAAKDILNPATAGVMDRMYQAAKPTFEGMKGAFAGDRTVGGLHSLATRAAMGSAEAPMGAVNPYFTPAGEEGVLNGARKMAAVPVQSVYDRIMSTMGK